MEIPRAPLLERVCHRRSSSAMRACLTRLLHPRGVGNGELRAVLLRYCYLRERRRLLLVGRPVFCVAPYVMSDPLV